MVINYRFAWCAPWLRNTQLNFMISYTKVRTKRMAVNNKNCVFSSVVSNNL